MSTQTTNFNFELPNGSDIVDPVAQIANNFQKVDDKLGVDYVTEQGTSNGWWYVKWKSGRAECGIYNKAFSSQGMSSWGNLYKTGSMAFGSYPSDVITWTDVPHVQINFIYDDSGAFGGIVMPLATTKAQALTAAPNFCIVRTDSITFSGPHLGIRVSGTCK